MTVMPRRCASNHHALWDLPQGSLRVLAVIPTFAHSLWTNYMDVIRGGWCAMSDRCTHLDTIADVTPSSPGCEDCLRIGGRWVHLRMCMTCGHVGCCDNSPNRHATAHFREVGHPLIRSAEPGEDWSFCYIDDLAFVLQEE